MDNYEGDGGHDPLPPPSGFEEFLKSILALGFTVLVGYVIVHFIVKYW